MSIGVMTISINGRDDDWQRTRCKGQRMNEQPWYQKGWLVLFILFVVGLFYAGHAEQSTPVVVPRVGGVLRLPILFGPPTLELMVWHQHPGNLENGWVSIVVDGKILREHSYSVWQPNEAHAVKFSFPLEDYDPKREFSVDVMIEGKGIKLYRSIDPWLGNTWKDNQQ
jgi:hypothetical protein